MSVKKVHSRVVTHWCCVPRQHAAAAEVRLDLGAGIPAAGTPVEGTPEADMPAVVDRSLAVAVLRIAGAGLYSFSMITAKRFVRNG